MKISYLFEVHEIFLPFLRHANPSPVDGLHEGFLFEATPDHQLEGVEQVVPADFAVPINVIDIERDPQTFLHVRADLFHKVWPLCRVQ